MKRSILIALIMLCASIMISCGSPNKKKEKLQNEIAELNDRSADDSIKVTDLPNKFIDRYEIIGTDHNSAVDNYYVFINDIPINKDTLQDFAVAFRLINKSNKSNINIIDSKDIYPLIKEYPLTGKDYINVADHFVAFSGFDSPENAWLYPNQDVYYKEQGGKNWKVKEIK